MTSSPHTPATVTASGGVLAGLAAVFLPLLQVFPQHLSSGVVAPAVVSGLGVVAASVTGKLVSHGVITKAELAAGKTFVDAHAADIKAGVTAAERVPVLERLIADLRKDANQVELRAADSAARQVWARLTGGLTTTAAGVTAVPVESTTVPPPPAPSPEVVAAETAAEPAVVPHDAVAAEPAAEPTV